MRRGRGGDLRDSAQRTTALVLYASAIVYASVTLWRYPTWTVDDAYIVFRYARHLAEHGRLTWNASGHPVEGYTGIALPVLVAAGMRAGVAPERLTRALGIATFFLAAWTLRDNQRRLGVPEPVRAYVTAGAMVFPPLYAHATSGLETMPFSALLGVCFGRLLSCGASPTPAAQVRLWLALLLLSFLRPEGVWFAAVFGALVALRVERRARPRLVAAAVAAAFFAVPYGVYFVWRATFYGRLLPNTYYAKAAVGGVDLGFVKTTGHLLGTMLPLLAAGAALSLLAGPRRWLPRSAVRPVAAAAVAVAGLGLQYSRSNLIMGYLYRFQVHWLFLALPLAGVLLASALRWHSILRRHGTVRGSALLVIVGVCLAAWPLESIAGERETRALADRYQHALWEVHARVAARLRDQLPSAEPVACWIDAGIIPFSADDHVFIDFGRLNDDHLARPGVSPRDVADYFFSRRPGALVLTSGIAAALGPQYDPDIVMGDPRFQGYERVQTYCSPEDPTWPCEILFLRRGVATR
jgi:arabinofuranosyltransferase